MLGNRHIIVYLICIFKNDVERGLCQSCVGVLEQRQCVCHLDTPRYPEAVSSIVNYEVQSEESSDALPRVDSKASGKIQSGNSVSSISWVTSASSVGGSSGTGATSSYDGPSTIAGGNTSEEGHSTINGEDTQQVTVDFLDENAGHMWSMKHIERTNLMDVQPEIELAKYLNRPALISSYVWSQTDLNPGVKTSFDPWFLFFNSTPIKNKIQNYAFISCTLHVKFIINASPFYSGALCFTYCPLQKLNGNSIIQDNLFNELIPYSQRANIWVYPQTNSGGSLKLPFFYHRNWLSLTSATELQNMGTITPVLYAPLRSANGATGQSVIVQIYAWAEDVKLHAPTISAAVQSNEFDYKPSQIASSVASAAGSLTRIPVIGPYMKATSVVASGFSKIAAALGFTNVPNNNPVDSYIQRPFPHMSSCEISVPTERSVVDPKNEVTIDPRTVGLEGVDELSIAYIAGRESYLTSFNLTTSDTVDVLRFASRVTPALMTTSQDLTTLRNINQYTPMAYLCNMFEAWRGDIIFRFKFVCTKFHKGRVRITFDPIANITTTIPDYTTVFNEIVDIGCDSDIEIRVPYMQAVTFLRTNPTAGNFSISGTLAPNTTVANGLITMRVVNPLSSPVGTDAITVLVFVRAADNIEYAHPSLEVTDNNLLSPYLVQSDEFIESTNSVKQVIAGKSINHGDPNKYLIHYGERIVSLRPLLHRPYHQFTTRLNNVVNSNTLTVVNLRCSRRLKYGGYDPNGYWTANNLIATPGTSRFSFNRMNIPQLVSLMFIGQRGSITWTFNLESSLTTPPSNLSLKWYPKLMNSGDHIVNDVSSSNSYNVISALLMDWHKDYNSGVSLTDVRNQPAISVNFPYYSRFNFQLIRPQNASIGSSVDDTDIDNITLQAVCQNVGSTDYNMRASAWANYGHDYNLFMFNNCPSLYISTIPTGAP